MTIRGRALLIGLVLLLAGVARGEDAKAAPAPYELHEWGVFTAPRDAEWLKQDMIEEWISFPEFFHGVLPKRQLNYRGPVAKPVIFFHGEQAAELRLWINFANGRPLIWWPPSEFPATPGGLAPRSSSRFAAEWIWWN